MLLTVVAYLLMAIIIVVATLGIVTILLIPKYGTKGPRLNNLHKGDNHA